MAIRFSITHALVALTIGAGFALILRQAVRGETWAIEMVAACASLLVVLLFHAGWYAVVRLASALLPGPAEAPAEKEPQA